MDFKEYKNQDIPDNIKIPFCIPDDPSYTCSHYPPAGIIQIKINDELGNEFGPSSYSAYTGCLCWEKEGRFHRERGPAVIDSAKGLLKFFVAGILLREEDIGRDEASALIKQYLTYKKESK